MKIIKALWCIAIAGFAFVLWAGGTAMLRHSEEYALAVDTVRERYPEFADRQLSLCLSCANSIRPGSSETAFRIGIVASAADGDAIVCVTGHARKGHYAYEVATKRGRCGG